MKVSIITPSFNQGQFLPVNLESVSSQTNALAEHIVVDPGSTDSSRDIARTFKHATLIAEKDSGQSDGINKGFTASTGDVLAWLNSDDFYPSHDTLSTVLRAFEEHPDADVVYGDVNFVDESGIFLRKGFVNKASHELLASFHYQVGIVQPGVFWRRAVHETFGGPSEQYQYCMDYELWVRFASAGLKWHYIPKVLAHHRWWSGMKTSSQRDLSLQEHFKVCAHYFGYVHWKWIDRYADYLVSGADGIVSHAVDLSTERKTEAIRNVVNRLVTGDMLSKLATSSHPEMVATREYISTHYPEHKRTYFTFEELSGVEEVCEDPKANERVAWNVFNVITKAGKTHVSYHVPDNFDRVFDAAWHSEQLDRTRGAIERFSREAKSDTCVIVGNGPSLLKSNLRLLQGSDVIISNFAFLSDELLSAAKFITVVNDLVARQGAVSFNTLNTIKIVPFWLGNYINASDSTFFVNATVKPHFSTNFVDSASWRSTVSFFNMQLAYAIGYKRVLLVGFDHFYHQNDGVREGDLIKQTNDDDNHFHPTYFKGKDWQAADVGNMERMYLLARAAFEADGREVVNCTVGGHLEVFRRGDLEQEIRKVGKFSPVSARTRTVRQADPAANCPRLLMIDSTPPDLPSATGQLKGTLLGDWPADSFLQVWASGGQNPSLHTIRRGESMEQSRRKSASLEEVVQLCREFRPDAIYFRPVDSPILMETAEKVIEATGAPFALHMMDDWPERLRKADPALFATMDVSLRRLIDRAAVRWSICDKMSKEYASRYGRDFEALANGVDLADFPAAGNRSDGHTTKPIKLQYFGALAQDMTFQSVMDIARAVADLQKQTPIDFRIHTMDWCLEAAQKACAQLPGVSVTGLVPWSEYHRTIADADIMVIAYNFDASSINYTRLSLANKMPECLASGAALLAYGPSDVATIDYLQRAGCACVVDKRDPEALKRALLDLAVDGEKRRQLARQARDFAASNLAKRNVRERFRAGIVKTAASASPGSSPATLLGPYSRKQSAHFDETDAVAAFLDRKIQTGTMLDVGAHHGYALSHFLENGWKIWAFEPDANNRAKLEARLRAHRNKANVTLDTRCVTNKSQSNLAFYQSEESTGISGLSAFRDSHREAQRVDSVSLSDYFKGQVMPEVDFLKIDTEGHDLFVLQGFPWDRNKPRVIECEFEDLKTKPLGYTTKDMADFLVGKGYTVYVSEWHPILRYGQRHDWHRLQKYPCELTCEEAWGNLLAFSEAPDETQLADAIKSVLKLHGSAAPPATKSSPTRQPSPSTPTFQHTKQFSKHRSQEWLLRHDPHAQQQLIMANFSGHKTLHRTYVGLATLESDQRVTVHVSVGRIGNKPYEGSSVTLDLTPGLKRTITVPHKFKAEHGGVKIQVDVKKCAAKEAKIRIETCVLLADGHDALAAQDADKPLVTRANQLFREQKYAGCIPLYLAASRRMGSKALAFNAQLALRRLGVTDKALTTKILQELTRSPAANGSKDEGNVKNKK